MGGLRGQTMRTFSPSSHTRWESSGRVARLTSRQPPASSFMIGNEAGFHSLRLHPGKKISPRTIRKTLMIRRNSRPRHLPPSKMELIKMPVRNLHQMSLMKLQKPSRTFNCGSHWQNSHALLNMMKKIDMAKHRSRRLNSVRNESAKQPRTSAEKGGRLLSWGRPALGPKWVKQLCRVLLIGRLSRRNLIFEMDLRSHSILVLRRPVTGSRRPGAKHWLTKNVRWYPIFCCKKIAPQST